MKFESLIPPLSDMEKWERNIPSFYPCTQTGVFTFPRLGAMWEWTLKISRVIHTSEHTALPLIHLVLTFPQSVSFRAAIQWKSCSGGDDSSLRWLAVGDDKGEEDRKEKRLTHWPDTAATACVPGGICSFSHHLTYIQKIQNPSHNGFFSLFLTIKKTRI